MELNDEGAALLAAGYKLAQGSAGASLTAEQCKYVNVDFLASFWMVSSRCIALMYLRIPFWSKSVKSSRIRVLQSVHTAVGPELGRDDFCAIPAI